MRLTIFTQGYATRRASMITGVKRVRLLKISMSLQLPACQEFFWRARIEGTRTGASSRVLLEYSGLCNRAAINLFLFFGMGVRANLTPTSFLNLALTSVEVLLFVRLKLLRVASLRQAYIFTFSLRRTARRSISCYFNSLAALS